MSEFNLFLENPYYKTLYNNAPENVKKYYRIKWDNNSNTDNKSSSQEKIKNILSDFLQKDWEYLINNAPSAQIRLFLKTQMQKYIVH